MELLSQLFELINSLIGLIGIENAYILFLFILIIGILGGAYFLVKETKRKSKIADSQMIMSEKCKEIYFKIIKSYKNGMKAEQFNSMMMDELRGFLNQVSEMFTLITRREVYSTLRSLEQKRTISKSKVNILQYSENCERDRIEEFRKILIGEIKNEKIVEKNTDFNEIIGENRENRTPYFYEPNLNKYNKGLKKVHKNEYKNTTEHWEKYYIAKIVVPIRMPNNKLFFNDKTADYDLIGFLTIDSKSKYAFSNRRHIKNFNLSILETYSAYLYIILSKYKYYLEKLARKEGIV